MTIDEYVCDGIETLMMAAAAQATEFTDARGALAIAFMEATDVLQKAWHDWLAGRLREEER